MGGPGSGSGQLLKKAELKDDQLKDLSPPAYLVGEALGFWSRHAPNLAANHLLTCLDQDSFASCCEAWADMQAAPPGSKLKSQLRNQFRTFAKSFGLFPDARKIMAVKFSEPKEQEIKAFDF